MEQIVKICNYLLYELYVRVCKSRGSARDDNPVIERAYLAREFISVQRLHTMVVQTAKSSKRSLALKNNTKK